jgi:hypothetical protein
MANRWNKRRPYACKNNRNFEGDTTECKSVGDRALYGLPNHQTSFEGFAKEQDNHFGGRRIRLDVFPVSDNGGELHRVRGDYEGIVEKVEKGANRHGQSNE